MTLRDLVRQALRMRPDRLVVGEVRGRRRCTELLAALNTGHEGGLRHGPRERRRATCRPAWRPWGRRPGWTGRPCTASWRRPCRWSSISYGTGPGRRRIAEVHVLERDAAGWW